MKLGPERVDEAAASLQRFKSAIDTTKSGEPAVLGVITTGTYGYVRNDGVAVIPVGALCPQWRAAPWVTSTGLSR